MDGCQSKVFLAAVYHTELVDVITTLKTLDLEKQQLMHEIASTI